MAKIYYATITLTNGKKINLRLDGTKAPESVNQFVKLVNEKYYDGTVFHRIIDNFMIQTGGYKLEENSLSELPEVAPIKGEFASNGFKDNDITHELGVISMARTMDKNSATSQFFICSATCPWLDGEYAAFGKTVDEESNNAVLEVSKVQTCAPHPMFSDFPVEPIGIQSAVITGEEDA
ncbi:MAG: peptidylprolyl isomerase [Clostridia bacterium]|nr:peptidylprolyl isomerase [Clostridia bacterium]